MMPKHICFIAFLVAQIMFMVNDTLERIRPKLHMPSSKEDCDKAVLKILKVPPRAPKGGSPEGVYYY